MWNPPSTAFLFLYVGFKVILFGQKCINRWLFCSMLSFSVHHWVSLVVFSFLHTANGLSCKHRCKMVKYSQRAVCYRHIHFHELKFIGITFHMIESECNVSSLMLKRELHFCSSYKYIRGHNLKGVYIVMLKCNCIVCLIRWLSVMCPVFQITFGLMF